MTTSPASPSTPHTRAPSRRRPRRLPPLALLAVLTLLATACDSDSDSDSDAGADGAATDGADGTSTDGAATDGADGTSTDGVTTDGASDADCQTPEPEREGEGTFYDADGSGNCSFPATPDDLAVAAMNHTDYAESAMCGACIEVTGPRGQITVRVVDRCPECAPGDVDLSASAFAAIADPVAGRVPITWRRVACDVEGPIRYHFKEGSNPWWSAVQVRDHRYQIARFEYRDDQGVFVEAPRVNDNFFVEAAGMGPGPYTFRVTDIHGHVVEDAGVAFVEGGEQPGAAQLAPCP